MSTVEVKFKTVKDLLPDLLVKKEEGKKHAKTYWQASCYKNITRLKVQPKYHVIFFRFFKQNLQLMEYICAYTMETISSVRDPGAYVLSEYKRRRTLLVKK